MNIKLILAGTGLFACATAGAAPEPNAWIAGVGAQSCGKLLAAVRNRNESMVLVYVSWTQGYMSGINAIKDPQAKNLKADPEAIRAYLTKHCQDKPLDDVNEAVQALTLDLYTK